MALYPFDFTGVSPANLITGEEHTVTSVNGIDHNYFVADNAPFFNTSLVVVRKETGDILVEGTDYYITHQFVEGVAELGVEVAASVTLIDKSITGTFVLRYQTLGGQYVTAITQAINDGIDALAALQAVHWDDIVAIPSTFPPTPHTQPLESVEGVKEIINDMKRIVNAINSRENAIHLEDVIDLDTAYVQPMLTALTAIATSVAASNASVELTTLSTSPGNTEIDIGPMTADTWTNLPLSLIIDEPGTYLTSWNVELRDPAGNLLKIDTRVTVDSAVIPKSYSNGLPIGYNSGKEVIVQARIVGSSAPSVMLSSDAHSSTFTLVRLSN